MHSIVVENVDEEIDIDEMLKEEIEPLTAEEPDENEPAAISQIRSDFPVIEKRYEDTPHEAFSNPEYYKAALAGEGEIVQKVHGILKKYLTATDIKDKGVFRLQFIPAFWEFLLKIAKKAPEGLPDPKKYLLRFGLLNPAMLSQPKRELLAKTINRNLYNQPVYYLDEWFGAVGTNEVKPSNVDEAKVSRYDKRAQYRGLLERAQGKFDGAKNLLAERGKYKSDLEAHLIKQFSFTSKRFPMQNYPDLNCSYNGAQKKVFVEIQEIMKQLAKVNREEETYLRDLVQAENDIAAINAKIKEEGNSVKVDTGAIAEEFNAIRQMAKMTIGSRGNHFPILTNDFFHCLPTDLGCRENIISVLAWIESIDPEAFCRVYKNQMNRIVPFVILLPGYGDRGICWEPLDHTNRAASRGRIAVPMYAKDLRNAVLYAVADLRWQVAKEKASFYWMEEGITGNYYQWFLKMKLKGDVKDSFISDYMVWIIKESDGIQKLPKELRGTFWRYLPFSQPVKDKLRTRSLTYQELYQRDLNRAMSDGY